MLHKVQFRNFKALRDVDLDLERLTVLVGPNASGKTSVLEGIHYLWQLAITDPKELFTGDIQLTSLLSQGTHETMELTATGTTGSLRFTASFREAEERPGGDRPSAGAVQLERYEVQYKGKDTRSEWKQYQASHAYPERPVPATAFVRLDVAQLVRPSYATEKMDPNGYGLSSVLAKMALYEPETFTELQDLLRSIIPGVKRIFFRPVPVSSFESDDDETEFMSRIGLPLHRKGTPTFRKVTSEGCSLVFDMTGARGIPASAASEGTVLVLGILSMLVGPQRPKVLLLDDVDRGLHPRAQKDLLEVLRRLMDQDPEIQIIGTSHSPYLLDSLKPEEVRLAAVREDASAAYARLGEHPDFERWKDDMAPGEFWSLVGEKWVTGLRAKVTAE
jgi:energy-coupling factor transporter ATP-binding protein EcfA2